MQLTYTAPIGQFSKSVEEMRRIIATAATGAMNDAGAQIKQQGRANIASAGFSVRWQNAMRVNLYPDKKRAVSLHPALLAYHKIPYAGVFENGATIAGSPYLWLPLPNVPTSVNGRHMSPANYIRQIGPLQLIIRPGKPPLLGGYIEAGPRGATGAITIPKLKAGARLAKSVLPGAPKARLVLVPLFFGIDKVQIAKKFALKPIFMKAAKDLPALYVKNLKP